MRGYVRRAKLLTENPAKLLGLLPRAREAPRCQKRQAPRPPFDSAASIASFLPAHLHTRVMEH